MTIAADEVARDWGGPIALAIAVAVFWSITEIARRVRDGRSPSPAEGTAARVRVNAQVTEVSDTDDTDRDTGWWGQIVDKNGRRYREVAHVVRTGSSLPPDDGIDLDLGDEEDGEAGDETREGETLLEYVDRLDRAGIGYAAIVRQAMEEYDVSEATAKRWIRKAREARVAS